MKKTVMLFCLITISMLAYCQDSGGVKELGIIFKNLDSYGLNYKWGRSTSLWRLDALVGDGYRFQEENNDNDIQNSEDGLSLSLRFGKEFRKEIANRFQLRTGVLTQASYDSYNREQLGTGTGDFNYVRKTTTFGAHFILGVVYTNANNFVFGVEILPGITYSFGHRGNDDDMVKPNDISIWNYGFNNSIAQLSVAYQF